MEVTRGLVSLQVTLALSFLFWNSLNQNLCTSADGDNVAEFWKYIQEQATEGASDVGNVVGSLFGLVNVLDCPYKFHIYHPCNENKSESFCLDDVKKVFESCYYDPHRPTCMVTIPSWSTVKSENVRVIVAALASHCNLCNIIVLDTSQVSMLGGVLYPVLLEKLYNICEEFAKELDKVVAAGLIAPKDMMCMSHSQGGQVCAYVSRCMKCGPMCTIVVADPAGPLYSSDAEKKHLQLLSKNDAGFVLSFHCNRGVFGTSENVCHKDIIVNNGKIQKGCYYPGCSHSFCNKLLMNAVLSPGSVQARQCGPGQQGIFTFDIRSAWTWCQCNMTDKKKRNSLYDYH